MAMAMQAVMTSCRYSDNIGPQEMRRGDIFLSRDRNALKMTNRNTLVDNDGNSSHCLRNLRCSKSQSESDLASPSKYDVTANTNRNSQNDSPPSNCHQQRTPNDNDMAGVSAEESIDVAELISGEATFRKLSDQNKGERNFFSLGEPDIRCMQGISTRGTSDYAYLFATSRTINHDSVDAIYPRNNIVVIDNGMGNKRFYNEDLVRTRFNRMSLDEHVVTDMYAGKEEAIEFNPTYAAYPQFSHVEERLQSILRWENPYRIDSEGMKSAAMAGLFCKAEIIYLFCFYCGVAVPPLEKSDDAWIQHAKVNNECPYVRADKGQGFLKQVFELCNGPEVADEDLDREVANLLAEDSRRFRESQRERDLYEAPAGLDQRISLPAKPAPAGLDHRISLPAKPASAKPASAKPVRWTRPVPPLPPSARRPNYAAKIRRAPFKSIQAREVRARLDQDWAKHIISIGYPINLVGAVIAEQLMFEGDDFRTFKDFLSAVVEASDMGDTFPVEAFNLGLTTTGGMTASGVFPGPQKSLEPMSNSAMTLSMNAAPWSSTAHYLGAAHSSMSSLQSENKQLKQRKMCKICFDNDATILFTSCGHFVVCEDCNKKIQRCPICRTLISGAIRTYLS